jgi:hypothetical protein
MAAGCVPKVDRTVRVTIRIFRAQLALRSLAGRELLVRVGCCPMFEYGYGLLARVEGNWDQARRHYATAVNGFIALGTPVPERAALGGLGRCHEADGDTTAAQARYEAALELGRRLGEPAVTASALEGLARLAVTAGDDDAFAARFVEAAGVRRWFHRPAPPHERDDMTHVTHNPDAGGPRPRAHPSDCPQMGVSAPLGSF